MIRCAVGVKQHVGKVIVVEVIVRCRCCQMFNVSGSAKFNFAHSPVHRSHICSHICTDCEMLFDSQGDVGVWLLWLREHTAVQHTHRTFSAFLFLMTSKNNNHKNYLFPNYFHRYKAIDTID